MEQIASIESRTRASFSRVKRDIDTLKSQIAKLRERDDALDHALSDYARSGELYERIKRIDERFAQLSDSYVTAEEFEKGVSRLVKEHAQFARRIGAIEKKDIAPEVASLRKELDGLERTSVQKKTFDDFVDKVTSRIERIDTTLERIDERVKRFEAFEKRLGALESIEADAKRLATLEKELKKLDGLDPKAVEKRLAQLESIKLSEQDVRSIAMNELENAVRVEELNEKIDEFNAALDSTAERGRVDAIEAAIADVRSSLDKRDADSLTQALADRVSDLEKRFDSERQTTSKEFVSTSDELDTLASRLSQFESLLAELRVTLDDDVVSVSEFNAKIDEFNAALESVGDAQRLAALEESVEAIRAVDTDGIEKRLESERHATNALITGAIEQVEALAARVDELSDPALATRLKKLEERPDASGSGMLEGRLDVFEARLDALESSSTGDLSERVDDLEAQLKVVIEDMGDSTGSSDMRVVENLARDLDQIREKLVELSEDVEIATKKPVRGPSLEHVQSEIEFLRSNVVMREDLESLRSDPEPQKKDNRITMLSDDLQRLFERQSELEKKVLSLETQNRKLKSQQVRDEKNVEISEKVPLRDPQRRSEPTKDRSEPIESPPTEEASDDEKPGALGKVRRWMVDFFTEEVEDEPKGRKKPKDELY